VGEPAQSSPVASAWRWVPTLYFCEGLPYVAVMTVSVAMYKNLGISNADIAFTTSWLYLPWFIKPLWSPLVDRYRTKRGWILGAQFLIGAGLGAVALAVPAPFFFRATLAAFWLLAFSSASHDIAADGFYLLALPPHGQAAFVGVRSTFYQLATVAAGGGLVFGVGRLAPAVGARSAWAAAFVAMAIWFGLAAAYHFAVLPRPAADAPVRRSRVLAADYLAVFAAFFRKKGIVTALAFLLLYRLAQAQLVKLEIPFLLDPRPAGGLGLSLDQEAFLYGTIGTAALVAGGLLGGYAISRLGLKRLLWPMVISMYLPATAFVALAAAQPQSLTIIGAALTLEQFGYGFGFSAYMVYMMIVAEGEHRTAHYALCTGFMALGMMLPGMPAGRIQEHLGYTGFFVWVCVATLPSFAATALIKVDPAYGRKT